MEGWDREEKGKECGIVVTIFSALLSLHIYMSI